MTVHNYKRENKFHPTSGLAFKTSLNSFKSFGGAIESFSAPSIAMGTSTPEKNIKLSVSLLT